MSTQLPLSFGPAPSAQSIMRPGAAGPLFRNAFFDGGTKTRRARGWKAPTASPNHALLSDLRTLRDRSRAACRNDGYAKGIISTLVSNIVGTGIKPQFVGSASFRSQAQALWTRWTSKSDAEGPLDFYGQQTQIVRGMLEGGEMFVILRPRRQSDGLPVPLQLQSVEPELCPLDHYADLSGGRRVRMGIERNAIGKTIAYHFHRFRPGDLDEYDQGELVRVPAESVIHLYDPIRAGQLRGIPHLTQALVKLYELDKYSDATLLRQQIANLFAVFITNGLAPDDSALYDPLTGQARADTQDDRPVVELQPGLSHELSAGEDVKFAQPPDPPSTFPEFMSANLRAACSACDVPYELVTGDMSSLNDRTMRVLINDFRRRIEQKQHQIVSQILNRPVLEAWLTQAFMVNALPIPIGFLADPTKWSEVKWMPQAHRYIHPVQDITAKRLAIKSGLSSRSSEVSETGEDAEVIDAEQKADNERAEKLGLSYESSTKVASRPEPADDPEPPNEGGGQKPGEGEKPDADTEPAEGKEQAA